jgi:bis(5'-nucleosyl)-tetraphosphatase (symmetrical)
MATYAVGDLQGHLAPLLRLMARVGFDAARDRLWLVGDLVNRGPESLEVLRFLRAHAAFVSVVLGNHDVHALARWHGVRGSHGADDTLTALLEAPDADLLMGWLRCQPLVHDADGHLMVHAGLPAGWSVADVLREAGHAAATLAGPDGVSLLRACFDKARPAWSASSPPIPRAAATINLLTRLRLVHADGSVAPGAMPPEEAPAGSLPWFRHSARPRGWRRIIFGHWAALGLWIDGDVAALDSGYVWGGGLTALRLDDGAVFQVQAPRGGD